MYTTPHELAFGEIYLPPLLLVVTLAYGLTLLVTKIIVKTGFYRYVGHPVLAEISLTIIFCGAISQFISVF